MRQWLKKHRSIIGFVILTLGVALSDAGYVHSINVRRHDTCIQRRNTYDGEVLIVKYLAKEFKATDQQTADALKDLYETIGKRPKC